MIWDVLPNLGLVSVFSQQTAETLTFFVVKCDEIDIILNIIHMTEESVSMYNTDIDFIYLIFCIPLPLQELWPSNRFATRGMGTIPTWAEYLH